MAPRKKRGAKTALQGARKTRSGKIIEQQPIIEETTQIRDDSEDQSLVSETVPKKGKNIKKPTKKFGKYRCLAEDISQLDVPSESAFDLQNETVKEEKSPEIGSFEPVTMDVVDANDQLDTMAANPNDQIDVADAVNRPAEQMDADEMLEVDNSVVAQESISPANVVIVEDSKEENENYSEVKDMQADMDFSDQPAVDAEGVEISEQFSQLNVVESSTTSVSLISESPKATDELQKSDFNVESLESEIVLECVSEEVIPITGDEEVPIDSEAVEEKLLKQKEINPGLPESLTENQNDNETPTELDKSESVIKEKKKAKKKTPHFRLKSKKTTPKSEKKKPSEKTNSDASESSNTSENSIRRSSRIKSINVQKQRAKVHISKTKIEQKILKSEKNNPNDSDISENSNSAHTDSEKTPTDSPSFVTPSSGYDSDQKPVKVKSRWRRSSELEMGSSPSVSSRSSPQTVEVNQLQPTLMEQIDEKEKQIVNDEEIKSRLKQFIHLKDNYYLTSRVTCKEAKKMVCDCFLSQEEIDRGENGCGEDCLNRLLMIECGLMCPVGDRCTNRNFQKLQMGPCEVFRTDKKGLGIRATAVIPFGSFILEYVGEVIDADEFENRATEYSKDKNPHYYFMALRSDAVIDATQKGNISRFINHSCDPNAETQKWTVNGELRIGFFSKRTIQAGEEITFDYHFQRYGKEAQKCYCEAATCRGWLGDEPDDEDEEEEEEEDDDDDDDEEEQSESVSEDEKEEKTKLEAEVVPEGEATPVVEEVKKVIKKEKRKCVKRKPRKDIFDDVDVDEEIEMLMTTGLKNQAHTLKLSRLMVRASEATQRTHVLRILRHGEFPCRRLFLDYHGLRLIHGWMNDAQQMCKADPKQESLRLELLQTLATLPIPNKTMLQDSKVLPTVEKWSVTDNPEDVGVVDSDSNSPKLDTDAAPIESGEIKNAEKLTTESSTSVEKEDIKVEVAVKTEKTKGSKNEETHETKPEKTIPAKKKPSKVNSEEEDLEIRKSVGMEFIFTEYQPYNYNSGRTVAEEIADLFDDDMDISPIAFAENDNILEVKEVQQQPKIEERNYKVEIIALALKLLEEWAILKEVFRIPKKERIEQMKEHEREADRGYKAGLELEHDADRKIENRYRSLQRHRTLEKDPFERSRKTSKLDERLVTSSGRKLNKHERRKLFALQVEVAERRKQDMLRQQHELHFQSMANDGRFAPYDPNRGYMWNPQSAQWPNYQQFLPMNPNPNPMSTPPPPLPQQRFVPNILYPYSSGPPTSSMPRLSGLPHNISSLIASMPPLPNVPPLPNMPPVSNIPVSLANIPTVPLSSLPPMPNMPPPNMSSTLPGVPPLPGNPPLPSRPPPLPALPYQQLINEKEELLQVKFAGPIPPPVKLPPKWKCAKDKYGRPYYYHIKIRKPQWEPPEFPKGDELEEELSESSSSSETSSLSSDSSSENDSDDDVDDTKLLLEIRKKFQDMDALPKTSTPAASTSMTNDEAQFSPEETEPQSNENIELEVKEPVTETLDGKSVSVDKRLKEEFNLIKQEDEISVKHRRSGLISQVHIISPRTEEDKIMAKENLRKYKENKERLKRERESSHIEQSKKRVKVTVKNPKNPKKHKTSVRTKLKEMSVDLDSETAKKIKETFRSSMASVMVGILNPYRKPECKEGRISNTEDFKHLARKLTHFVMLKELKHCQNIDDLTCTDSVKSKAREFVRKYMSKFGEMYNRPKDDLDY